MRRTCRSGSERNRHPFNEKCHALPFFFLLRGRPRVCPMISRGQDICASKCNVSGHACGICSLPASRIPVKCNHTDDTDLPLHCLASGLPAVGLPTSEYDYDKNHQWQTRAAIAHQTGFAAGPILVARRRDSERRQSLRNGQPPVARASADANRACVRQQVERCVKAPARLRRRVRGAPAAPRAAGACSLFATSLPARYQVRPSPLHGFARIFPLIFPQAGRQLGPARQACGIHV